MAIKFGGSCRRAGEALAVDALRPHRLARNYALPALSAEKIPSLGQTPIFQ